MSPCSADGSHVSTLRLWNNSVAGYTWGFDSDSFLIDTDEDGRHKVCVGIGMPARLRSVPASVAHSCARCCLCRFTCSASPRAR